MTSLEAVFRDRHGLHPRAAHRIQETVAGFESRLALDRIETGESIDARSMLGLISSGVRAGERVRVTADGPDEAVAAAALKALLDSGVCHP